jgi:hypothetical protein
VPTVDRYEEKLAEKKKREVHEKKRVSIKSAKKGKRKKSEKSVRTVRWLFSRDDVCVCLIKSRMNRKKKDVNNITLVVAARSFLPFMKM